MEFLGSPSNLNVIVLSEAARFARGRGGAVGLLLGAHIRGVRALHNLVAEWIHFTLPGIASPTIKQKVYAFGAYELSN